MNSSDTLNLPYLAGNQQSKHVTVNESLRRLDALVHASVTTRSATSLQANPAPGSAQLRPADADPGWEGAPGDLFVFQDGAWAHYAPRQGWQCFVEETGDLLVHDGADWLVVGGHANLDGLGVAATPDPTNRLVVRSPASLFTHDGDDHRIKLNRAGSGDTATLVFQTDFVGEAEIGLTEPQRFDLKASQDGTNFSSEMTMRLDTGFIGLGMASPNSRLHLRQGHDARITIESTQAGSGAGFDIGNTTDGQSWRVTGQWSMFKLRDHTAGLDKLILRAGVDGDVLFENFGRVGIGVAAPMSRLDVDGPVRVGQRDLANLEAAEDVGTGAMAYVTDASGRKELAVSDGANWRWVSDQSVVV